ncbi:MAG: shikimate kinase [Clostridiales bacterium]|jgi:shikimate kinase|nr:shikimate kinase [Clostridiales bacterium]
MNFNIVLIGMPGSGKSTVGVVLAKKLGFDFLDTDILLSKKEGVPLSDLIVKHGYEDFLMRENELGKSVKRNKTVIATGGSMPLSIEAMENLKQRSVTVYLKVPLSELNKRLPKNLSDRGVAAPNFYSVADIYNMRRPFYEKYADIIIDCKGNADGVAQQIIDALEKR